MKSQTSKLREEIYNYEESEDRLRVLQNQYKGETGYIIAGGPSLKKYDKKFLNDAMMTSIAGISAAMKNTG